MILLAMTLSAIVSSSIFTPLYPNAARTSSYATPITRMASGSNEWDEPRRNFLNGIGRLVQRIEQLSRLGLPLDSLHHNGRRVCKRRVARPTACAKSGRAVAHADDFDTRFCTPYPFVTQ